jgi:alpha-tubulin suppressor-like RCC1 family protein
VTGHGEGRGVWLPRLLQDLSSNVVVSVSTYEYHTACITKTGEVFTWGNGKYGRLGHGDESDQETPKCVEALIGVNAKQVSSGRSHTAVCTEDGQMYTFGKGKEGQLGHGDTEDKYSPALVQALVGKHITQVQCGYAHTMALTSSGYVFIWGGAAYGELGHGNGKLKCFSFPCLVEGLREHNVVRIANVSRHYAVLVNPTSPFSIRQSQQASFNNEELSDVVLMVKNQPLYAHINVLTQKSDYFAAMFRSNLRESIERVVNVSYSSKAAFLHVLEYLYFDDFTVSMDDIVELWVLADMYQMEGLKYYCMGKMERGLCEENVSQILQEVEDLMCPCDELKRMCHEFLERHTKE